MKDNKKQNIYKFVMLIIVGAIIVFVVTQIINFDKSRKYVITEKEDVSLVQKLETSINAISKILGERYLGNIDEDALIDGALKGMVESVGDVYTEYYTKKELSEFTATTLGNFVGIGIYMQSDIENDTITIISAMPDTPAEKAGLKMGDQILKVDGVEYKAEQIDEMASHVKGEEGTEVTLTILREGETLDVTIKREKVHINYVTSEMLDNNIGYISIATFDEGCANDFSKAYDKVKDDGANKLIIDLRSNGGGVVDEALSILDMICEKDENLLITVDRDGKEEIKKSKTDPTIKMPIVVLTNQGTASCSEIFVSALKENGKAEIVGEKTYGKGVIQELIPLSNGGALKVTVTEYFTPNKNKINGIGIEPDYKVSSIIEQLEKAKEILNKK